MSPESEWHLLYVAARRRRTAFDPWIAPSIAPTKRGDPFVLRSERVSLARPFVRTLAHREARRTYVRP